jgi:hypothetical protein
VSHPMPKSSLGWVCRKVSNANRIRIRKSKAFPLQTFVLTTAESSVAAQWSCDTCHCICLNIHLTRCRGD